MRSTAVDDATNRKVFKVVSAKCATMLQREVADLFGISQSTVSVIMRRDPNVSQLIANKILGAKDASVTASDVDAGRVRNDSVVPPRDQPGCSVRDEPVQAREGDLPGLQGQGRVGDVVQLGKDKVIPLPKTKKAELEVQNQARVLASLPPLKVKVVRCLTCRCKFETVARRMCSRCTQTNDAAPVLSGNEVFL